MNILSRETRNVQNPALGAMLLWRFASGYERTSATRNHPNLPLLFMVLPLLFHEEIASIMAGTKASSGLRVFADKFASSSISKSDLLVSLSERIICMKALTIESLMIGISSSLLSLDARTASVVPLTVTAPRVGVPESIKKLSLLAEKLGGWCSSLTNHEIGLTLKIGL